METRLIDGAIAAAREATRAWGATPAIERGELLHEVAARMRARTDELAGLMTREGGKPLVENSDEVGWTAAAFDDPLTDNDAGPFGGMKQSGLGRELGQEGLEAFQETKHVRIETAIGVTEWWYPYG